MIPIKFNILFNMRFTGTIGDSRGVELFIKIVTIVSKLFKKRIVIRITPNEFSFVNAYNIREGLCIDFRILKDQLFSNWIFDGISPENNAVFFDLSTEDLLVKKDNVPHLRIELTANSLVNEIPITLILVRNWQSYNPPNIGPPSVAVNLPLVKNLSKILSAVKNMGARSVAFRVNNIGEFSLCALTEMAKVDVYARDLTNLSMSALDGASSQRSVDEFSSVVLELRILYPFVSSLHPYINRIAMKVVDGRGAILCADEPECQFTLYIAGQQD